MGTNVIKLSNRTPSVGALREAVSVLAQGGLVAFPTETVYGVGARADVPEAVRRLREVKGRDAGKAFTVHVDSRAAAQPFIPPLTGLGGRLVRKAWPGPLTILHAVPDPEQVPAASTMAASTRAVLYYDGWIGLRCPDDAVAAELLGSVPAPIIASSANKTGSAPPQTGGDVLRDLQGRIDVLIDTGRTRYSKPSTIIKLNARSYEIVREGVYDAGSLARLATVRLLFVCTGNTCRSPMAAGIAAQIIADRLHCSPADLPGEGIVIRSAGTAGGIGGASETAIRTMAGRGIDIKHHTSAALTADMVHQSDYVFTMTHNHRDAVIQLGKSAEGRVSMVAADEDVTDPVGGTDEDYAACARIIERGLRAPGGTDAMKIAVSSDHRGFRAKGQIKNYLERAGHTIRDFGCADTTSCDYPDSGIAGAEGVACGEFDRGILLCGTGIGMSMAANKVRGVRAALCHDELTAEMSRRHNNANILCLPADLLGDELMRRVVDIWLRTEYEGGRHDRRLEKIAEYERRGHRSG